MPSDIKELRSKNAGELSRDLSEKREALRRFRFELASGRIKNIRMIRETRRSIAKILTVLAEKEKSL